MSLDPRAAAMVARAEEREELLKQSRWPSGAPGGKGGQFAPGSKGAGFSGAGKKSIFDDMPGEGKGGKKPSGAAAYSSYADLFGAGSTYPGGQSPGWGGSQMGNYEPPKPPPGAKPHGKLNDKGKPVTINYPTKPSDQASWTDPKRTATFTPGGDAPASLNGVAMKAWRSAPTTTAEWAAVSGQNPKLDADMPFQPIPGKSVGAGVIIKEPDGRLWLTKPTNEFGGYKNTYPKGTVEDGLSLQASAIKEAYEETGLQVRITGVLGDFERTTSKARFYVAERIGGTPSDMGWESQAMRLATKADARKLLNMPVDRDILAAYLEEDGDFEKAAAPDLEAEIEAAFARLMSLLDDFTPPDPVRKEAPKAKKGGAWQTQPRWPSGTPLGGQWKEIDGDGFAMPPTIAGGLSGSNSSYQKKANALYDALKSGNKVALIDAAFLLDQKAKADVDAGKKSSHVKWHAQLSQYANSLVSDLAAKPKAEASATRVTGPIALSSMKKVGSKPGGSNPGGMYQGPDGGNWLVKGNKQFAQGTVNAKQNDDRAKNEVLAAKLMQAAGVGAPKMALVDLEGQYGGGLGVASKMVAGGASFDKNNPAHIAAARKDYATHAWLGNYDVLGMGYDNTIIVNGSAVNIDPGGAILFRAQGLPKEKFGKDASEFETMRVTTGEQKAVYGGMTASELKASAENLAYVSDEAIKKLVDAHGPGTSKEKADLADTLIARRDAILAKVGLKAVSETAPAQEVAPPTPPKLADAVPAPAGTSLPSAEKPTFNSGLKSDAYYAGLVDKAQALHAAGDLAGLKAMIDPKKEQTWAGKTANSQKLVAYHGALVSDLQGKQDQAVASVAQGNTTFTDGKGQAWKVDDKGVLQPAGSASSATTPLPASTLNDLWDQYASQVKATGKNNLAMDDLANAALAGDAAKLSGIKVSSELEPYKAALLNAMTGPAAPAADPVAAGTWVPNVEGEGAMKPLAAGGKLTAKQVDDLVSPHFYGMTDDEMSAQYDKVALGAQAGDTGLVMSATFTTDEGKAFQNEVLAAMSIATAPAAAKALSGDHLNAILVNAPYNYSDFKGGALGQGKWSQLIGSAEAGDLAGVQSIKMNSAEGKAAQAKIVAAMTAAATRPETPPEPAPAVAVPKGAAPNFDAYKTTSAANPGHNPKVDAIKAAFEAGDEKSLLAMSFGTNTYGKKQAQLANDALAAMGSAHKVTPGQKKGEHPALIGGLSQPVPSSVKAQPVPPGATPAPAAPPAGAKPKPTMADLKVERLPPPPDMLNYNGNGKPYSSKAWKNEANQQALNAVLQAGLTGGPAAIDALTFDELNPETGQPTGKKISVNDHPAKKVVVAYAIDVKNAITDFLNPPVPLADFNHVSASSVQELAKSLVSPKGIATVQSQPKEKQFGFWIAMGNTDVAAVKPAAVKDYTPAMKSAGKAAYKGYSKATKEYISHVQSSGQINRAIDEGKDTYAGMELKPLVKQLYKDATPLEPGSAIYRWQNMPPNMMKQMTSAKPGLVFQSAGGFCTSMNPTSTSHFGGNRVKLIAAPGAKAIHSHGSGGFPGEEEITTLPGQRYVLLSRTKMANGKWDMEVLILPPDDDWANSLA